MVDTIYCVHCGAVAKRPVTKIINGQQLHFCCNGCLSVYEMLAEDGLQAGGNAANQPAPAYKAGSPSPGGGLAQTVSLPILGMSCANCAARVEAGLREAPGVLAVQVDLAGGQATVEMLPGQVNIAALKKAVTDAGYDVGAM